MPDFETRPDLLGNECEEDCRAEVVQGVHNGVGVFWAQHGTVSNALPSGKAALEWLHEKHLEWLAEKRAAEEEEREARAAEERSHGLAVANTGTEGDDEPLVEGVPT